MARKIAVEIVGDSTSLERSFARSARSASKFNKDISHATRGAVAGSGAFRGLGRSVAFASGAFLGGAGITAVLKDSVDAASNLAEQTSKANVVFGQSAKAVEAWSRTSVNAMGVASDQALETAGSFGALLKPLGVTGAEAAKQSEKLTQLGADLASFYNTSVTDALDAVRSGLVGESEPLRRYGILLSEARVQQEALVETGKKNAKQLTAGEKLTARQALIFKDSAQAAGDFARTSGGLANQQRILSANIREMEIRLGTALMPMIQKVVAAINEWLGKTQNQQRLIDTFKQAVGALTTALNVLRGAFAQLNAVTGSTKRSLELLVGAFAAFKTVQFVSTLSAIAGNVGLIGTRATQSAGKVGLLRGRLTALVANPYTVTIALVAVGAEVVAKKIEGLQKMALDAQAQTFKKNDPLETILVPRLAKQIAAMKQAGQTSATILATLRKQLGGSLKADDLIAEAFSFSSGSDPKMQARIRANVQKRVADVAKVVQDEVPKAARAATTRTAEQRNTWFDQMIGRQLGRVEDIASIKGQISRLRVIAGEIQQRIDATKDITRKLTLEDQLLEVVRRRKGLTAELAQSSKAAADAVKASRAAAAERAKAAAEQRAQTKLEWAEFALEKAQDTKGLRDDIRALRVIIALIKQQIRLTGLTVDKARQLRDFQKQLREALHPPRAPRAGGGGGGGGSVWSPTSTAGTELTFPLRRMPSAPPPRARPSGPSSGFGGPVTIHTVNMYGVQDVPDMERQLQKRAMARPQTRRGPV